MSLHTCLHKGNPALPCLVFLHGFSGDSREWQAVGERLGDYPRLYIDLPGHGASAAVPGVDFEHTAVLLQETLEQHGIVNYWLIGYSLGGRIGLCFASLQPRDGLRGVIVEGSHPGLTSDEARRERREGDLHWARRFARESLHDVFTDWYRQPVFASLTRSQLQALVALRCRNHGIALAEMLMATSLSAQPDLRPALAARYYPFYYLCGERDAKFIALAQALDAPCTRIPQAGHNAHRENPDAVAACLAQILKH